MTEAKRGEAVVARVNEAFEFFWVTHVAQLIERGAPSMWYSPVAKMSARLFWKAGANETLDALVTLAKQ